jgi:AcrR family transcriptional regulator
MNIQARSHRYHSSRETILATSRDVFLRNGFTDASMDTIAQRSGVSKTTLYAHFESKEALFNQVIVDVVTEHADDASALFEFAAGDGFRDKLIAIACRMLEMRLAPETTALIRLCVIEGARMPRLSYEYLTGMRSNLLQSIGSFLREHADANGLAIEDWHRAADLFIVFTMRDFQLEAMLPWSAAGTPDAYRHNAEQVADLMLRLYQRA